ncbi:hypothetical protein [Aedoeadaptatus coxii]|uniref:hypothetical protein n=1 Tax=Aedoeadaptatus coxii TaxID=755172 RepID=UPI002AD52E6B|nr:hypothetical protein [Peptoniphilus coxii]
MPAAFSSSYAVQAEKNALQLFKKRRSLFYAEANALLKKSFLATQPNRNQMAKPFALLEGVMVERIGVRGKERGRIATAYSFSRKISKMNALLFKKQSSEQTFKKMYSLKKLLFKSVSYNPKTMSRGRGKRLRGKGRVSLFPARPISLSGRHYNEKCLRHFPDYCLAPAEVILQREIKSHAHLATAKFLPETERAFWRRSPIQSKPVRASDC